MNTDKKIAEWESLCIEWDKCFCVENFFGKRGQAVMEALEDSINRLKECREEVRSLEVISDFQASYGGNES